MAYIKLDIIKTNYQLRTTGGENYIEVYINPDYIVGIAINEKMVTPGKYREVPVACVTSTAQYRVTRQCIEEPKYEYEYYVYMNNNQTWSVTKDCYEAVKSELARNLLD